MTIEEYSSRLRNEVDLEALSAYLLTVVDQTMEPTHTSLWLRPPRSGSHRIMRMEGGAVEWPHLVEGASGPRPPGGGVRAGVRFASRAHTPPPGARKRR
jgi:hypothetical protein